MPITTGSAPKSLLAGTKQWTTRSVSLLRKPKKPKSKEAPVAYKGAQQQAFGV